jgi:RHS repeat-associated protein
MKFEMAVRVALLGLLLFSEAGQGQEAPTGDHYAGRPTDTGFGGTLVGTAGDAEQSLPLDLPPERAGLPIPLEVRYSAHRVGAAGLGWDVPLYYLQHDNSFAHRRPMYLGANGGYNLPQPRARTFLNLPGMSGELVRRNATDWILRQGALDVVLRESGTGWMGFDGSGRTYVFSQPAALLNQGFWLLSEIRTSGGRSVHLDYQLQNSPIPGGRGVEMDLARLTYNATALSACPKNEIQLIYNAASAAPMSLSLLGYQPIIRRRTLAHIEVQARARCGSGLERLRRIDLTYLPDADTQLPQLVAAHMVGRELSGQPDVTVPLGTFRYGTATQVDNSSGQPQSVLKYATVQTIPWPSDTDENGVAWLGLTKVDSGLSAPESGQVNGLWQDLIDVNGDGRPDFIYQKNGKLSVLFNFPDAAGATGFNAPALPLNDATFQSGPLEIHSSSSQRFWYGSANRDTVDIWRRTVDINGDGRLDVIDAAEEPGRWVIYLNTPGGPNGVKWLRRSVSVKNLEAELVSHGHVLVDHHVPLSRRSTGVTAEGTFCIDRSSSTAPYTPYSGTVQDDAGHVIVHCNDQGVPDTAPPPICIQPGICKPPAGIEKTFVEWDLLDLNGDGYPDFAYNSAPVNYVVTPGTNGRPFDHGNGWFGDTHNVFALPVTTSVRVAFNILGVHLDSDPDASSPFARSIPVNLPELSLPGAVPQGVALWSAKSANADVQEQVAGFVDVNGDGLADRVSGQAAYLGVYVGTALTFSSAFISLPNQGHISTQSSTNKDRCGNHDTFNSNLVQGLRDLTGDGIPDYIDGDHVYLGTGAGFSATPVKIISSVDMHLSDQPEMCEGQWSATDAGLYDIDGDGKPDWVSINASTHTIAVAQLMSGLSARAAEAGRLTDMDTGYGASTHLTYQSAKEDRYSTHAVPYSEIVVTKSATQDGNHLGGRLAELDFAYGNVSMQFDAQRDRFLTSGYGRTVRLQTFHGKGDEPMALGTVTDTWPREPYIPALCQNLNPVDCRTKQWLGLLQQGQPRDVYTLKGSPQTDAWSYLAIDANDVRIRGDRHTSWSARLMELPTSTPNANNVRECLGMAAPYDFASSFGLALGPNGLNPCLAHGFIHPDTVETWFGQSPPPWGTNIQTRLRVVAVDNFGRTTVLRDEGDVFRGDDDVCTEQVFATPAAGLPRVLSAVASVRAYDCDKATTFSHEAFSYDALPAGRVNLGRMTSHQVDRRATDDGTLLRVVPMKQANYDAAGNIARVLSERQGLIRTQALRYDPFGLAPVSTTITATGLAPRSVQLDLDPLSLAVIGTRDIHGVGRATTYDGLDRPLQSTVTLPAGASGVVSSANYQGFDGLSATGRQVTVTQYPDPVAPNALLTAVGRTSTSFLDELGRVRRYEKPLGADYANERLIVHDRMYDEVGRLSFEAEPYAASQVTDHFGTSYFYDDNGELNCLLKGVGVQPYSHVTDVSQNRFVTCVDRAYDNHQLTTDVLDANTLTGQDPQQWVKHREVASAVGWVVERSTVKGASRLEYATLGYDRLGNAVSLTRFQTPDTGADPVSWVWRRDSLGNPIRVSQPEASPREFEYDDWGELTDIVWKDGAIKHRISRKFDALGRLIESNELNNGVPDPAAVRTLHYDTPAALSPLVTPRFVQNQLAGATWAGGKLAFSYDALGRTSAEVMEDTEGDVSIEDRTSHWDGSPATLAFRLPDRDFAPETIRYGYDSAGRMRSVDEDEGHGIQSLYRADTLDAVGRVLQAHYGPNTTVSAQYESGGRQSLQSVKVLTPSASRQLAFGAYDALGRETNRQEFVNGAPVSEPILKYYNDVGQLASVTRQGSSLDAWKFVYDGLGNLTYLRTTNAAKNMTASARALDKDRICRVEYAGGLTGSECNVVHDGSGSVIHEPTRVGTRDLKYFASGLVRSISDGTAQADFSYDALGRLQTLNLQGGPSADQRRDRHFGELITRRDIAGQNGITRQWLRRIPGPTGTVATQQGALQDFNYPLGEARGNRFVSNDAGDFVQELSYTPFGEAASSGAAPATADYTPQQWNGGDALSALGVSQLGARLYDPAVGRFLSRDPVISLRGALGSHPYTFAMNDPINASDPSGLDCVGENCQTDKPIIPSPTILSSMLHGAASGASGISEPQAAPIDARTAQALHDEAMYQAEQARTCGQNPESNFCDTKGTHEGLFTQVVQTMLSIYVPNVGVPSYYVRTAPSVGAMQRAQNGVDYFNARDRYNAARATVALTRVREEAARYVGAAMSLSGAMMSLGAAGMSTRGGINEPNGGASASPCSGGSCGGPGTCFVAGTPVATSRGAIPIEKLRLGERVIADNAACANEHLPPDAVTIKLELENPAQPSDIIHVEFVRPREWLTQQGYHDGQVRLEMPEQGLDGWARVLEVGPPPPEQSGAGCLVVATTTHIADRILALKVQGGTVLELTPPHRLYVEGQGWTSASAVRPGQSLRTLKGPARLLSASPATGHRRVFNLEVDTEHSFRVGDAGVWAHNACTVDELFESVPEFRNQFRRIVNDFAEYESGDFQVGGRLNPVTSAYNDWLEGEGTLQEVSNTILERAEDLQDLGKLGFKEQEAWITLEYLLSKYQ